MDSRDNNVRVVITVIMCFIIKNENTLQLAVRSKISSKLIFARAVCDTPIARITSCVSLLRI